MLILDHLLAPLVWGDRHSDTEENATQDHVDGENELGIAESLS